VHVLVTGCAGFIGYHLCERLLNEGQEVVGVDDLSTGQRANVEDLQAHRHFEFHERNIAEPLPIGGRFDLVYNLACPASPTDFGPRRLHILEACSRGVWNLLDFCRRIGARLLHTSTSEVYGDPEEHPQKETYWGHVNPIGPRCCYDEGKRFAEALITNYVSHFGTDVRLARVFNTYGPRMRADDGRALPNFISQALAGQPLTVHGDGSQTRSFCYVSDTVAGILAVAEMEADAVDPERPVYNLGNGQERTILEFAETVIDVCASDSRTVHVPNPHTDDPARRCPDTSKLEAATGWRAEVNLRTGLEKTVAWFRQELQDRRSSASVET
jgi:nucleoside-diphosphate-sugar epimerase